MVPPVLSQFFDQSAGDPMLISIQINWKNNNTPAKFMSLLINHLEQVTPKGLFTKCSVEEGAKESDVTHVVICQAYTYASGSRCRTGLQCH